MYIIVISVTDSDTFEETVGLRCPLSKVRKSSELGDVRDPWHNEGVTGSENENIPYSVTR